MIVLYSFVCTLMLSLAQGDESPLELRVQGELNTLEDMVFFPILRGRTRLQDSLKTTVQNLDDYHGELRNLVHSQAANITDNINYVADAYALNDIDVSTCLQSGNITELENLALQEFKGFIVSILTEVQVITANASTVFQAVEDTMIKIRQNVQACIALEDEEKDECLQISLEEIQKKKPVLSVGIWPLVEQHNVQMEYLGVAAKGGLDLVLYDILKRFSQILDDFLLCALELLDE